jgi:hypothetical protein
VLNLREGKGSCSPASGGVSGVPGVLDSLSKRLECVEDELALEDVEVGINDGRFGVSLAGSLKLKVLMEWEDNPAVVILPWSLPMSPFSGLIIRSMSM